MNKKLLIFLLCLPVMLSCYNETTYGKSTPETPVITEPPIIIQEEETKMLKAIKESHNYFIKDNKELFSIDSQGVNLIDIIDQDGDPIELVNFFRKNNESFFTIKTYKEIDNPDYDPECDIEDPETECAPEKITEEIITFYKQAEGEISKIDILPNKPPVSRTQYESQTFTIQNNDYEGTMVTDVRNEFMGSEARFFLVNGAAAYVPEVGLFFHVQDGLYNEQYMVHENGLYVFPEKSKSVVRINTTGVLW